MWAHFLHKRLATLLYSRVFNVNVQTQHFTSKLTSTTTDDQLEGISCFSFFDWVIRKSLWQKIYAVVLDSSWRPHL